jgi:hypothetical protein
VDSCCFKIYFIGFKAYNILVDYICGLNCYLPLILVQLSAGVRCCVSLGFILGVVNVFYSWC